VHGGGGEPERIVESWWGFDMLRLDDKEVLMQLDVAQGIWKI